MSLSDLDQEIANVMVQFVTMYEKIHGTGCIMQDVFDHLQALYNPRYTPGEILGLIESAMEYMVLNWDCTKRQTLQYEDGPLCKGYDPEELHMEWRVALY